MSRSSRHISKTTRSPSQTHSESAAGPVMVWVASTMLSSVAGAFLAGVGGIRPRLATAPAGLLLGVLADPIRRARPAQRPSPHSHIAKLRTTGRTHSSFALACWPSDRLACCRPNWNPMRRTRSTIYNGGTRMVCPAKSHLIMVVAGKTCRRRRSGIGLRAAPRDGRRERLMKVPAWRMEPISFRTPLPLLRQR